MSNLINRVWNCDQFIQNHQNNTVYLEPTQTGNICNYTIRTQLDEEISHYAFHRLNELSETLNTKPPDSEKLINVTKLIYQDFIEAYNGMNFISKIFFKILSLLHFRHSKNEITNLFYSITIPMLGTKLSSDEISPLMEAHRNPSAQAFQDYDQVALTSSYERRYNELLKENAENIKELTEPQLAIFKADLKERAAKEIYQEQLPSRVKEGYYNPAIIPHEITKLLGPLAPLPLTLSKDDTLYQLLDKEVNKHAERLTKHQRKYIKKDVKEVIQLYQKVYLNKTRHQALALGRDLIRIAIYQEHYDKSSFTGSDHGSKHIHHNIKNGEDLHQDMEAGEDYNDKDRLMERLIHFYHDIGYSVGLASQNFSCCKDHPFIGAKMIEENKDYFCHYLDKESFDVIHESVLLHAIVMPNLHPDAKLIGGMHPKMIRAVSSISDACAVTYDRKTQEFWEQPATLIAVSRLRAFLTQFPHYIEILSHPGQEEWYLLDRNNPLDVLAHDVYQKTKKGLHKAVTRYDIPEDKRNLFRQAIDQQFNAFTTKTTLGQYGGVLTGLGAITNTSEKSPKYLPEFKLAPSILYGIIRDLFGEDMAQASFKKLIEEFGGNLKALNKEIGAEAQVKTGNAYYTLQKEPAIPKGDKHFKEMHKALRQVVEKIESVYGSEIITVIQKAEVMRELQSFRTGQDSKACDSLLSFVAEYISPYLPRTGSTILPSLQRFAEASTLDEIKNEKSFAVIENMIRIALISDEEYQFIHGKKGMSRLGLIQQLAA